MGDILLQAFIYLCAAVVAVPIASRLGLGSVLGYLLAGVLIGPVLGFVGSETQQIQHVAEFGVVMMLFLVGLELDPKSLWSMRTRLFGLGGLQVALTTAGIALVAMLLDINWQTALVVGMVLALSSTAIVLQTLNEKGLARAEGGQASFSVLLFQDIAAIPMLAIIPLLAIPALMTTTGDHSGDAHGHSLSLVAGLAGWQIALVNLGAISTVIIGGHYLSHPLFRFIAMAKLREVFTAAALLLVIGIALLMTLVGLSPALGAFLAGVVLANSEFRHELESNVAPFKGLLLGLFFITVGAGVDFPLLFSQPVTIAVWTAGLIAIKVIVLLALSVPFKLRGGDRWLFALSLAQAGEFGFVLLAFATQNSAIGPELAAMLLLVVALSMLVTPLLFIVLDKIILPGMGSEKTPESEDIDTHGPVIIAGHGRFGQIINRILLANGYKTVVLDYKAEVIDNMRRFGVKTYYGDASRPDLMHSAGLHNARLLVVAIDDVDRAITLIEHTKKEHPSVHIIARARDRIQVYRMYRAGADDIVREMFDSSVRASRYALEALGHHPFDAERSTTVFVNHDLQSLRKLASLWNPDVATMENQDYIDAARNSATALQEALSSDQAALKNRAARRWVRPGADE